jgi:transposase InsO family protein
VASRIPAGSEAVVEPTAISSLSEYLGQGCLFPIRMLVQRAGCDEVASRIIEPVKTISVGDPFDPATPSAPVIGRPSLTWDRGAELAQHARLSIDTGLPVYFADPHSPWQRGTNENTNGLLRQYFPKGTDLSRWNAQELAAVAFALNTRPRKSLGWKTPEEAFSDHLSSLLDSSVATTT